MDNNLRKMFIIGKLKDFYLKLISLMIISIKTDRSWQTMQAQVRLLRSDFLENIVT